MKTARVNARGLEYIKAWITATAGNDDAGPLQNTDARALDAWACEAEESMNNGNPPLIEMNAIATASGHTETFSIPSDGVEWLESSDD
jgi:hypothetical protein